MSKSKRKGKISRSPRTVYKTEGATEPAWYYENKGSIDVIARIGNQYVHIKLRRKYLADWIARTGKSP